MMNKNTIPMVGILGAAVVFLFAATLFVSPAQAGATLEVTDCVKCHQKEPATIDKSGGLHKSAVSCLDCHLEHGPAGTEIIPNCSMCHEGTSHFELGDNSACLQCHSDPHEPLGLQLADDITKPCLTCHEQQGQELAQFPSLHTEQSCTFCHEAHGQIPDCSKCHEPHVSGQIMTDCLACHPVHQPLQIMPAITTARAACVPCHEDIGELMSQTTTKHQAFTCAFCHRGKHPTVPKCEGCHGEPHSPMMHQKMPNCLDCHIDAHNLQK